LTGACKLKLQDYVRYLIAVLSNRPGKRYITYCTSVLLSRAIDENSGSISAGNGIGDVIISKHICIGKNKIGLMGKFTQAA